MQKLREIILKQKVAILSGTPVTNTQETFVYLRRLKLIVIAYIETIIPFRVHKLP